MNLRPYQSQAVDFLLQRDRAFIHAPAGSGKTVIGAHAVARSGASKVQWLCNTKEQQQQAIAAIEQLEGDAEVDVSCVQSQPDTSRADLVVFDECFPAGTLVDERPIETLQVGDTVTCYDIKRHRTVGRRVSGTRKALNNSGWVRLICGSRQVVCTLNHPIFVLDIGYVPAIMLLHIHEHPTIRLLELPKDVDPQREAPLAPLQILRPTMLPPRVGEEDGGKVATTNEMLSMWESREIPITENALGSLSCGPGVLQSRVCEGYPECRILREDGGDQFETGAGTVSTHEGTQPYAQPRGTSEDDCCVTREAVPCSSWRQWQGISNSGGAGGCVVAPDGVGGGHEECSQGVSEGGNALQNRHCRPDCEVGNRSGWPFTQYPEWPRTGPFEGQCAAAIRLDRVEVYQCGSETRPEWVPEEDTVYNLEVEGHHNYFANGILVHNCHHVPAMSWLRLLNPNARLWGLSATPWSKDKDRDKIIADTFKEFFTIEREQLIGDGHLVPGEVRMIDWGIEGELDLTIEQLARPEIERRLKRWPWLPRQETESRVLYQMTRQALENSTERLLAVVNAVPKKGQTLILVGSIEHGLRLAAEIDGSAFVSSKTKVRRQIIEDFKAQRFQVLIATSLADEGLDCPCASALILAAGGRAAGKLEQRAGRVLRPFPGKEKGLIIDFWDKPARLGLAQAHARLRTWRRLGYAA